MKNLFRVFALAAAVSVSLIPTADAAGFCSIVCGDGKNHSYVAPNAYECCETFYSVCLYGNARYDGMPCPYA
jgi:hypothetical protein